MDQIPLEVIGNILSRLGGALNVVIASATCRKWREACRKHLHTLSFNINDWPGYRDLTTGQLEILITQTIFQTTGRMGPRWKGKDCEMKALADPMSDIVSHLQRCFGKSNAQGRLTGCNVILVVGADVAELLGRACFGRPVVNCEKDKLWFQLGLEEALYLCFDLGCLKIVGQDGCEKTDKEVWQYALLVKSELPCLYKGYSHLRKKNWVVRPGSQYGVDFVVYRHHPSLVHSEYAVLVLSEGEGDDENGRLRVWSDVHCTTRLCGSVAKTLLVLYINKNGHGAASPSSLESYLVEERTITRWSAEQNREE